MASGQCTEGSLRARNRARTYTVVHAFTGPTGIFSAVLSIYDRVLLPPYCFSVYRYPCPCVPMCDCVG